MLCWQGWVAKLAGIVVKLGMDGLLSWEGWVAKLAWMGG
jgi:hypothetical protein